MNIINNFEEKVSDFLKAFSPGTNFLAAVSGGADSMAMLAALCALNFAARSAMDNTGSGALFRLSCVHVEHGLRPAQESQGDADYVRDFCEKNGIECFVKHIPQGKIESAARRKGAGIEAAARFYRHRALSKYAAQLGENTVILLAHTKDDLLETALMRVIRGAGSAGLAAMPAVSGKNGYIIARPLLQLSRAEIECYLKAKNTAWREDSTNTDEKFLRNRIRRRLVPFLNNSFPSWKAGISSMAQTQSLVADFIAQEAKNRVKWNKKNKPQRDTEERELSGLKTLRNSKLSEGQQYSVVKSFSISTDETNFFVQPQIIREEAVFQAIDILSCESVQIKSIKRKVIRRFCEGKIKAADLGIFKIRREKGNIILFKAVKEFFESGYSSVL